MTKYNFIARLLTILLILWSSIIPYCAFSDTIINTSISKDTTWTKDNGTIILQNTGLGSPKFDIASGATLTIEEGVTVKFDKNLNLYVYGSLIIKGNKENPVKITSAGDFKYGGIQILNGANQIQIDHAEFSYFNDAIKINQNFIKDINITNTTFRFNNNGITGSTKNLFVDSCTFVNNRCGIYTSYLYSENSTVQNSIFLGNKAGVENHETALCPDFNNCIFTDNAIAFKYFSNSTRPTSSESTLIKYCQFSENVVGIFGLGGLPTIIESEIIYNKKGLLIEGSYNPGRDMLVANNWICENDTALINRSPGSLYSFTNNCWCENDLDIIKNKIFDFDDSGLLGITEINPIIRDCKKDFRPTPKFGFSINGKVNLNKSTLLKDGVVLLYQVGVRKPIAMMKLYSGYFNFTNITEGKYKIYIIPNPAIYPTYLPTYHSDTIRNGHAHILNLTGDADSLDITLNRISRKSIGVKEERKTFNYKDDVDENTLYAENWFPESSSYKPQLNAVKNLTVFQHDEDGNIVDWKLSDHKGEVIFQESQDRNYTYTFERIGYSFSTRVITNNNVVVLDKEVIDGFITRTPKSDLSINYFPNPAKNILILETERDFTNLDIIVYDINGLSYTPETTVTDKQVSIQVGSLMPGMYLVRYNSEGSSGAFKFIKN